MKYFKPFSMRQTFLNTKEDMDWLREVHLPELDEKYQAAVIYGNEDFPEMIEVYLEENPSNYDDPVIFVLEEGEEKKYKKL